MPARRAPSDSGPEPLPLIAERTREIADADLVLVLRPTEPQGSELTKGARHGAAASTAVVDVCVDRGRLTAQITDDGRGLGDTGRRSGLANLRRRAEGRGGMLEIAAAEPRGTSVCWSVPIG